MHPKIICLRLLAVLLLFTITLYTTKAQSSNPYTYQELSHAAYAKLNDSLKKHWICPSLYKEKEVQKKYKEIWDNRIDFITGALERKDYITEKEIFNYVAAIVDEIVSANKNLVKEKPILLLDRSAAVNAYAIGGNMMAVNLGLISFAESREEIALVIAHELAHNILNHADNSMKEKAEWLTSAEYKNSLNAVLDSKYERYSRLKKVIENYSFSRSRHNRYHEAEADSLAISLLRKTNIGFDAKFFLRLDSSDLQFKKPLQKPIKDYFAGYATVEDWWTQRKTKGLSTRNYNFRDTTGIKDSLKTHPDCIERYKQNIGNTTPGLRYTAIPASIKQKANKIIIWNLFDNLSLSACLYNILLAKDAGHADEWYDFMMHNVFAGLNYSDKELMRFNAIGITPKELISKDYYEMQNMLEQMPAENLKQFYKGMYNAGFWNRMSADAKALKILMATLLNEEQLSDKKKESNAKEFITNHPQSMFCEFAEHFTKK